MSFRCFSFWGDFSVVLTRGVNCTHRGDEEFHLEQHGGSGGTPSWFPTLIVRRFHLNSISPSDTQVLGIFITCIWRTCKRFTGIPCTEETLKVHPDVFMTFSVVDDMWRQTLSPIDISRGQFHRPMSAHACVTPTYVLI